MSATTLSSVIYPTDFSDEGLQGFAHALRVGVANRSTLHLLHIGAGDEEPDWTLFPRVRKTLIDWGMLEEGAAKTEVGAKFGLRVRKAHVKAHDPVEGIVSYLGLNECDLLVFKTHTRTSLQRALQGSVSESAARLARAPTLFLRERQKGFVNTLTGEMTLRLVLMPVDMTISPLPAWFWLSRFLAPLSASCELRLLHVGEDAPPTEGALPSVELRQGPVVDTIISYANEVDADLIAMPTAGRHGVLDALQGSTTERVIHNADQPVLAIPTQDRA
jgi:nucleotide-binding universal stress UspA family protein